MRSDEICVWKSPKFHEKYTNNQWKVNRITEFIDTNWNNKCQKHSMLMFFFPTPSPLFFFWYEYNAYGIYYYFSLVFFTSPDVTCYRSTKNDWHYIIIWNRTKALFESSTNEISLLYIGISSFLLLITAQIQSKWKFWHFKSHCNMNEAITYTSPLQHRRSYGVCWCDVYFNICR